MHFDTPVAVLDALVLLFTRWYVFVGAFVVESIIGFWADPKFHIEIPRSSAQKEYLADLVSEVHSGTLSVLALVVAVISIIAASFGQSPHRPVSVLTILSLSASFLMLGYLFENLARTRPFWAIIQERSLHYGALGLFAGLVTMFRFFGYPAYELLGAAFLLVLALRSYVLYTYIEINLDSWPTGVENTGEEPPTRLNYIQARFAKTRFYRRFIKGE